MTSDRNWTRLGDGFVIPGRYSFSDLRAGPSANHEVVLTIGDKPGYFNALDLLEVAIELADLADPDGCTAVLRRNQPL